MTKRPAWTREALLDLSQAYRASVVLNAAATLDVFSHLSSKPRSARETAKALDCDHRAMTVLLDALAALGFVTKARGRYGITASVASLLSSASDRSVLPMVAHGGHLLKSWARLDEVVRSGAPVEAFGVKARTPEKLSAFIGAMRVRGIDMAKALVARIGLEGVRRVLDVGAGPGTYAMAFLRASKRTRVTLFDLPPVVAMAKKNLRKAGLIRRADCVPGDFEKDPLPQGHDLAWVSAIIHQQGRSENRKLYRKIRQSLVPGGRIVIRDHILDPTRTRPKAAALFALNMLVRTRTGGCYTFEEIRDDLCAAGFRKIRLLKRDSRMDGMVEGVR